jgi:hypothetical protein
LITPILHAHYTTFPGARDLPANGRGGGGSRLDASSKTVNAGAPVLTVQALLGHKFVDTTLGYARLYDGTIAADYYRAMAQVEKQLDLQPGAEAPTTPGHLLAMMDALQEGMLTPHQKEILHRLRQAILMLT